MASWLTVHQNIPSTLLGLFEHQDEGHGLNTRYRNYPKLPRFQTELVRRSLLYRGRWEWMNLDAAIKTTTAKEAFKDKSCRLKMPIHVHEKARIISIHMQSKMVIFIDVNVLPQSNFSWYNLQMLYYHSILFCWLVVIFCHQVAITYYCT